jgi:hypothetical protein
MLRCDVAYSSRSKSYGGLEEKVDVGVVDSIYPYCALKALKQAIRRPDGKIHKINRLRDGYPRIIENIYGIKEA